MLYNLYFSVISEIRFLVPEMTYHVSSGTLSPYTTTEIRGP